MSSVEDEHFNCGCRCKVMHIRISKNSHQNEEILKETYCMVQNFYKHGFRQLPYTSKET